MRQSPFLPVSGRLIRVLLLTLSLTATGCSGFQIISTPLTAQANSPEAILLFAIGMHIEPLGAVPSAIVGGGSSQPGQGGNGPDYHNRTFFERHVADIKTVVGFVEKHGGRLTVQAQSPFTQAAVEAHDPLLADLEARGHEIGLHFHEDAHLGRNPEGLPVETWCAVMKEEIGYIHQAGVVNHTRYWSGGNLYPGVLDAASCAGLDVNSDWKNPKTQQTDELLIGINPWRPAAGPRENNVTGFARHDPQGKVIFLPEGLYDRTDFASMRRSETSGGDQAYFDFLKESLERSLKAAQPDRINVFHFTVHPGEFRGDPKAPFAVIDRFLTDVVDPLVATGKVRWATFSQMADAFAEWERTHPGVNPRSTTTTTVTSPAARAIASQPASAAALPMAYMTFAVNVHDFRHIDESADTILRLIGLFEKYGVKGDFYLTGPMVQLYAEKRPDVISRLHDSGMTINYHVRPPHPLYTGFDQRLKGLDDQALAATLRDYETYRLDLATGDLIRDQPGGYGYVAQTLGRAPVTISAPNNDPRIKTATHKLLAGLGAQMTVIYHETGTDLNQPFEYREGLLVRPSDFSITRWAVGGQPVAFWWNMLDTPLAADYDPMTYLQKELAAWQGSRPPFITSLIHENNFYRSGPESWTLIYYADKDKTQPLSPPFNLNAPDPSHPRSAENQEAIWAAYEQLVAYAAANLKVVTSEDIVVLAKASQSASRVATIGGTGYPTRSDIANIPAGAAFDPAKLGTIERDVTYCNADGVALKMDIYYPQTASGPFPVAVYVHGGGWTGGDKASGEGIDITELVARGYLVAAVNYRLAPRYKFPAQIEDVKCAVRFLRAHGAQYGINPEKIGAWGGSAGGHLVSLLGLADESAGWDVGPYTEQSSRVQAVVDMFGPSDLTVLFNGADPQLLQQVFGSTDRSSEAIQRASPVSWVTSDDPPFLILHGEKDGLVPLSQSQELYDRLTAAGVPATLLIVKNAGHGFTPVGGPISPSRAELTQMIAHFFDRHLK